MWPWWNEKHAIVFVLWIFMYYGDREWMHVHWLASYYFMSIPLNDLFLILLSIPYVYAFY